MPSQDPQFEVAVAELMNGFNHEPFHQFIGLRLEIIEVDRLVARLSAKPEMVGLPPREFLHGGAAAAAVDAVGAAMALVCAREQMRDLPAEEKMARFFRLVSVDMRVDYLKVGKGRNYSIVSAPLRVGKTLVVNRTDLFDDRNVLVAAATGTFSY